MILNEKDEWETPQHLFNFLNLQHEFVADACATSKNKKCKIYFKDALKCDWYKTLKEKKKVGAVFMNPPYSNPSPFLNKAWEESKKLVVVCLVPSSILTCKYMDRFDLFKGNGYYRTFDTPCLKICFLTRRTHFHHPTKKVSSPPGGCMVLIMDRRKEP